MSLKNTINNLFAHKWRTDEAQSAGSIHTYQACLKTGERRVIPAPAGCGWGYQPIDEAWLKGEARKVHSPLQML